MKEKLLYYMSFVTILIAMIGMVYFIYLQLYPFKVVELKEFKVFNTEVKAGSPAKVLVVFKKNNPFTSETQWNLICDKNGDFPIPRENIYRDVGKNNVMTYIVVPSFIEHGTCKLSIILRYYPTPLRIIPYIWESNNFQVVP